MLHFSDCCLLTTTKIVYGNEKPFGILLQSKENEDLRKMHAWQTEVCLQWVIRTEPGVL